MCGLCIPATTYTKLPVLDVSSMHTFLHTSNVLFYNMASLHNLLPSSEHLAICTLHHLHLADQIPHFMPLPSSFPILHITSLYVADVAPSYANF